MGGDPYSHWICKCGQPNQISRKICLDCEAKRPKNAEVKIEGSAHVLKRPKASIRRKAQEKKHPELFIRY